MIHIEGARLETDRIEKLMRDLRHYDMILLTSRFAVQYFFQILEGQNYDPAHLKRMEFLVIGKSTARALDQYQFEPALIAQTETSEGLLKAITAKFDVRNRKILFPRSSLPNPYLKEALAGLGADVEELTVYRNTKLPKRDLPVAGIDKILFTSPSTVKNFLKDYHAIPGHWKILSKGPVTRESLKEAGYESEVLIYDQIPAFEN
jgi:uroporphyrinogen-III synthase